MSRTETIISTQLDEETKCSNCNDEVFVFYRLSSVPWVPDEDGYSGAGLCARCFIEWLMNEKVMIKTDVRT
jgi:hypothetical protein